MAPDESGGLPMGPWRHWGRAGGEWHQIQD